MRLFSLPIVFAAAACGAGAGPDADRVWHLQSIDGRPFGAPATLQFRDADSIAGRGPCNSFGGRLTASWPDFATGPLRATRRACPELAQEQAYFAALGAMTEARLDGERLILTGEGDRSLVFTTAPAE